jgi:hypothetical protein
MRVVTYLRVSTGDQVRSGLGIEAQRAALAEHATRQRWHLIEGGLFFNAHAKNRRCSPIGPAIVVGHAGKHGRWFPVTDTDTPWTLDEFFSVVAPPSTRAPTATRPWVRRLVGLRIQLAQPVAVSFRK